MVKYANASYNLAASVSRLDSRDPVEDPVTQHDRLATREEIRKLIAAYPMAGDRHSLLELANCFTPDGTLETPTQLLVGRVEIVRGLAENRLRRSFIFVRHHMTTTWIDVINDKEAAGCVYWFTVTDKGLNKSGVYSDEYQLLDGSWLIRRRLVDIDYDQAASG
jgi:hypothetical protein